MIAPLEKRINAYEEFNKLKESKFEKAEITKRIVKNFGVTSATVYQWFRGNSPYGLRAGRVSRTKELFYVLGALLGDGYIYHWRNRFRVGLSVRDKSFVRRFANKLSKILGRRVRYYHYRKRDLWFANIHNAELFFIFKDVRKDLTQLDRLLAIGNRHLNSLEFLRGFIDAEGCVKLVKEESRKTPKVVIDVTNKNLQYLKFAGVLLGETLGMEPHFSSQFDARRKSTYHHLRFYKKADVKNILLRVKTIKNRKPQLISTLLGK